MVKTVIKNKYVAAFIFSVAFASLGFGVFEAGETHAAWEIYTNGFGVSNPGALECFQSGALMIGIPSKDIVYLGNGEWRILEPDGRYQVFSKSMVEGCLVTPGAPAPQKEKAPPVTTAIYTFRVPMDATPISSAKD